LDFLLQGEAGVLCHLKAVFPKAMKAVPTQRATEVVSSIKMLLIPKAIDELKEVAKKVELRQNKYLNKLSKTIRKKRLDPNQGMGFGSFNGKANNKKTKLWYDSSRDKLEE